MESILSEFKGFPSQEKVVSMMLKYGISVKDGHAYCGIIELADSALGRAAGVDRRVIRSTIERIETDDKLKSVFASMRSMALLSDVAPLIGCTALEIIPTDSKMPGILADITSTIYDAGISMRQAVIDEGGRENDPRLLLVLNGQLPPEFIPKIRGCRGVAQVIIR